MRGQPARPGETYEASRYHYEGVHNSAPTYQYQGPHGQQAYWGPQQQHHQQHQHHHLQTDDLGREMLDWNSQGSLGHPPTSPARRRMGRPALWFAAGCCFMVFIIAMFTIFLVWALNPTTTTSRDVPISSEPAKFDCTTNFANWESAWSIEKRQWCCETHSRGCSRPLSPALVDLPGEGHIYDCRAGLSDWQTGWSLAKRGYCCQTHGIGCPPQGGGNWKITFDCTQEYASWKTSWSDMKKGWCCETTKRGCPDVPPSTTWPPTTTETHFECDAGRTRDWSLHEQAWCCTHHSLGCHTPASPSPAGTFESSQSAGSFDCSVALSTWERSWTEHKKAWCCVHENKACFGYVYHPPSSSPQQQQQQHNFDPAPSPNGFGSILSWPSPTPTPTTRAPVLTTRATPTAAAAVDLYDCNMHYTTWEADWSIAKQVWCCNHRGHGCTSPSNHEQVPRPAPPPQDVAPYNCHSNFEMRELWNPQKQAWCCDHEGLGCSSTYDCRDDGQGQSGWSDDKRRWCCEAHGKGCESARFDCHSGENDWRTGWSTFKQAWCCAKTGKGCT